MYILLIIVVVNNDFNKELYECVKCVGFNIRIAMRAITQHYDDIIKPSGILGTQFTLLVTTKLLEPITITKLAEKGLMDRTTLSRNIKPLIKMGLLRIKPSKDKRKKEIEITDEGLKKLEEALPLWKKAQEQVLSGIGYNEWNSLRGNLFQLIESVI